MTRLITAIEEANIILIKAGLPRYDEVVELLQASEKKLKEMQRYQIGTTPEKLDKLLSQIDRMLDNYPYP